MPLTKITGGEFESSTNSGLIITGIVTATSFSGSASNLTGLTGASANTYGNATATPQIVVDANGRITSITNVAISAGGGGGGGGASGVNIRSLGSLVGFAGTIDFGTGLSVTPLSSGSVTVTVGVATYATVSGVSTTSQGLTGTPNINVGVLTTTSLVKSGGTSGQFLKADGSVDSSTYLTSYTETDTITTVTNRGNSTSNGINVGVLTASSVRDSNGNVRTVPQNSQTSAYILTASDVGKHISITTGGVTVNSGIFSAGDAISIYNNSASNQTITQGASVTMYLAGTATTGNRTLAQRGVATILCVGSNTFVAMGGGLT